MIKRADLKLRGLIIFALVAFSVFYLYPVGKTVNLGLDLKGGAYILLRADTSGVPKDKIGPAIEGAIEKIRRRVDDFGVKEAPVTPVGKDSILVQIPGRVDRETIARLREVGKLEFKLVDDSTERIAAALKGEVPQDYELKRYKELPLLLEKEPAITGADLEESFAIYQDYMPVVTLQFNSEGGKKFATITEENVGRQLAIVLDEKVISAPQIRTPILNGKGQIEGDFSFEEARILSFILNSGALPVPLVIEEERTVGPLLGSDSIQRGINSIILGAALVVIFMLVYYYLGGIIAVICLVLDLLFVLAGLRLFKGTLTLPGIAGMILTLGMAVDANVLIFERIREELNLKKPLSVAVKNGFDRAKRAIFDANITTLIAAVFLYIFGTGPIRGFATTLSLGIIASIFTAVFVGRTIFSFLLSKNLKKFPMLKMFPSSSINFVKMRGFCLLVSFILIAVGMLSFYNRRADIYGIDFKGGQVLEYKLTPTPQIEDVRKRLDEGGLEGVVIQEFSDIEGGVMIKSKDDISDKVTNILGKSFEKLEELRVTTVGPAVGAILKRKAVMAILLSLLGILVYVGVRFKHFDFALAAVIALFHDVIISLGFLSLFGFEINLLTITALLTIAGYSINDTIVIYDRIREITPRMPKLSLAERINYAINNNLSRTIITSLTTIMVVVSIYLLGGEALRGFSFALLVGFVTGTYSSIYIASPLVLLFEKPHRKKR